MKKGVKKKLLPVKNPENRWKKSMKNSKMSVLESDVMENKEIRVLLIEDDPDDALLLKEVLTEGGEAWSKFRLECHETLEGGLARLTKGGIDVILLDLSLPDSHGLDTFTKTFTRCPSVPIIVLTGLDDKTLGLEALWQGAQDYLVKGRADNKMLLRVIRYAIERNRLQTELRGQSIIE